MNRRYFALTYGNDQFTNVYSMGLRSHDPCFHVFLIEARVMTFVAYCTLPPREIERYSQKESLVRIIT